MKMKADQQNVEQNRTIGDPRTILSSSGSKLSNEKIHDYYRHRAKWFMNSASIGGCLAAAATALCHHTYLATLDETEIVSDRQFRVKSVNNIISQVVVLCITVVAMTSLIQSIWYSIGTRPNSLENLDRLFALPSPLAMFSLLLNLAGSHIILPALITLYIRLLLIITTSAPNALSIKTGGTTVVDAQIPTLNLSELLLYNSTTEDPNYDYRSRWRSLFTRLATTEISKLWDPPPNCKSNCSFEVLYSAPTLSCRDIQSTEVLLKSFDPLTNPENWTFYTADFSLKTVYPSSNTIWTINISYIPSVSRAGIVSHLEVTKSRPVGISCQTSYGTYLGQFTFKNHTKQVTSTLIPLANAPNVDCLTEPLSQNCRVYYYNTNGMLNAFLESFQGTMMWGYNDTDSWVNSYVWGKNVFFQSLFQYAENNSPELTEVFFYPNNDNLSQAVENLFSNLTLSSLVLLGQSSNRKMVTWGSPIWKYRAGTLWEIYGIALGSMLIVAAYGHFCNRSNYLFLNTMVSNFFLTTRDSSLRRVCVDLNKGLKGRTLTFDKYLARFLAHGNYVENMRGRTTGAEAREIDRDSTTKSQITQTEQRILVHDSWARFSIIFGITVAIFLGWMHHIYLIQLRSRPITSSQFWIKTLNNAFSQFAAISLGLTISGTVTQAVWKKAIQQEFSLEILDHLFRLPLPQSFQLPLIRKGTTRLSLLLLFALTYQALAVIGILTPNSLTAGFDLTRKTDAQVPFLDLSKQASISFNSTVYDLIGQAALVSKEEMWDIPPECRVACLFHIEYEAPAISCSTRPNEDLLLRPYNIELSLWSFYSSNWFYEEDGTVTGYTPYDTWGQGTSLNFSIDYIPASLKLRPNDLPQVTQWPVGGVFCFFRDGKYRADFRYSDHKSTIKTTLLSYSNSFEDSCQWSNGTYPSSGCQNYAINAITISRAMSDGFAGVMAWCPLPGFDDVTSWFPSSGMELFRTAFDYQENMTGPGTYSLTPKFHDLSTTLTELFSNITTSLLLQSGDTVALNIHVSDGALVWKYNPTLLWAIYGTSFLVSSLIAIYGLFCIHSNGMALEKKFSTFLMSTRTQELDDLYESIQSHDAFLGIKLRYDNNEGHFVVGEVTQKDEGPVEPP
ncbi:hypothetical protein CPB86DRAFT_877485 [Serendipita vermifera]|nr:hypothetical protein CPB86DRAFT_877485 [Serendipita vermifera]